MIINFTSCTKVKVFLSKVHDYIIQDMSPKCVANVIDKKSVFPIEVKCEKFTIYSV